jgi:hypothetical protein
MKVPICASFAKERFETPRQHSTLHSERIVGNPAVIPRDVEEERALPPQSNSVKTFVMARAVPGPRQWQAFKNLPIRMVAGYREIAEIEDFSWLRGELQRYSNQERASSRPSRPFTSLAVCFQPVPVSRLLGAISTYPHATPAPRPTAGVIRKEECASRSLASLYVGEIL